MIRSADAAGVGAVIFTGDSVDPFNPKTLRSSAGSVFHLPLVVGRSLAEVTVALSEKGISSYASVVRGGSDFRTLPLGGGCAIVIGNESSGLDEAAIALCDASLSIPMAGRSESLNAGVAASLVLFEALHQRGTTRG